MRFLVDECVGPALAHWLREQGHDVFSVYEQSRGLEDDEVINKAVRDNRILITNDKDFGEKIFREKRDHRGVVLFRLKDERSASKIRAIRRVLHDYAGQLEGNFIVITETQIRISGR